MSSSPPEPTRQASAQDGGGLIRRIRWTWAPILAAVVFLWLTGYFQSDAPPASPQPYLEGEAFVQSSPRSADGYAVESGESAATDRDAPQAAADADKAAASTEGEARRSRRDADALLAWMDQTAGNPEDSREQTLSPAEREAIWARELPPPRQAPTGPVSRAAGQMFEPFSGEASATPSTPSTAASDDVSADEEDADGSAARRQARYERLAREAARAADNADPAAGHGSVRSEHLAVPAPMPLPDLAPPPALAGHRPLAFRELHSFELAPEAVRIDSELASSTWHENNRSAIEDRIPESVTQLHGKAVTIRGFVIPIDFQNGGTNHFLMLPGLLECFFCMQPMPHEWIEVRTADGKRLPYPGDDPIVIAGDLEVGPVYENRFLTSLYRIKARRVID